MIWYQEEMRLATLVRFLDNLPGNSTAEIGAVLQADVQTGTTRAQALVAAYSTDNPEEYVNKGLTAIMGLDFSTPQRLLEGVRANSDLVGACIVLDQAAPYFAAADRELANYHSDVINFETLVSIYNMAQAQKGWGSQLSPETREFVEGGVELLQEFNNALYVKLLGENPSLAEELRTHMSESTWLDAPPEVALSPVYNDQPQAVVPVR